MKDAIITVCYDIETIACNAEGKQKIIVISAIMERVYKDNYREKKIFANINL